MNWKHRMYYIIGRSYRLRLVQIFALANTFRKMKMKVDFFYSVADARFFPIVDTSLCNKHFDTVKERCFIAHTFVFNLNWQLVSKARRPWRWIHTESADGMCSVCSVCGVKCITIIFINLFSDGKPFNCNNLFVDSWQWQTPISWCIYYT